MIRLGWRLLNAGAFIMDGLTMRIRKLTLGFTLLIFLTALIGSCAVRTEDADTPGDQNGSGETQVLIESRQVFIETSDSLTIVGSLELVTGVERSPACLLVHMLGSDRSSYSEFQQKLLNAGISSLAIDMRGHGDSTADGSLNYRDFRAEEWSAVVNDIKAGMDFLRSLHSIDSAHIGIVGASIGANLAVVAASEENRDEVENTASCLVLLSPGINYREVRPLQFARDLGHIPVYIASAEEDMQSYRGSQSLSQAARGGELFSFPGSDHGTDLFDVHMNFMDDLVAWLEINIMKNTESVVSITPEVPDESTEPEGE